MSLPLPPWRAAHYMEGACPVCTYLLDKNLVHWGFAIAAHLKVQGKERKTVRKKEEGGVTSWDKCKLPPHHRKTTRTRFSSAALGKRH